jgi:hypothetical protein
VASSSRRHDNTLPVRHVPDDPEECHQGLFFRVARYPPFFRGSGSDESGASRAPSSVLAWPRWSNKSPVSPRPTAATRCRSRRPRPTDAPGLIEHQQRDARCRRRLELQAQVQAHEVRRGDTGRSWRSTCSRCDRPPTFPSSRQRERDAIRSELKNCVEAARSRAGEHRDVASSFIWPRHKHSRGGLTDEECRIIGVVDG